MIGRRKHPTAISMAVILIVLALVTVSCTFSLPLETGYEGDLYIAYDPESHVCSISMDEGEWNNTVIYYTFDGTEPDDAMAILYEGPFRVLPGMTVRAVYFNINPVYSRSETYVWHLSETGLEAVNE